MKKINFFWLLPIVVLMIAASCKKNGMEPQETISTTGSTDTTGTTAYSAWYTPTSYTKDTTAGTNQFYTNIPALNITQDTLKNDTVLVYSKLDGYNPVLYPSNLVSPMPVIVNYSIGSAKYTDTWSAHVMPGSIQIIFVDNQNFSAGLYYAHKFRYLIRPKGMHNAANVNVKKYTGVRQVLHPPD